MKITKVELVSSNTESKIGGTGFQIRTNNQYVLSVEETTVLGFKATNQIEVPLALSKELDDYLNSLAKKSVEELKVTTPVNSPISVSGHLKATNVTLTNWTDSINNQTI